MMKPLLLLGAVLLSTALACSDDVPAADGPALLDANAQVDIGVSDAPLVDAPLVDAHLDDAPLDDVLVLDAVVPDAVVPDGSWTCPTFAAAAKAGTISTSAISETSGLAASAMNPGVLWLHNDSGDTSRVFAISDAAKLLGEYSLQGAKAVDWEDMALGPGPVAGSSYIFVGDIGDNAAKRTSVTIYRVVEPKVSTSQTPAKSTLSGVDALPFTYPDGAHNAETLLVDPQSGDLYIITKSLGSPAGIYLGKAPQQPGTQRTLTKVGAVPLWATGGDIAADRSEIVLRSYFGAHHLWRWPKGTTLAAALSVASCKVPAAFELQGEAIAVSPKTGDCFTLGEGPSQPLYRIVRK